MKDISESMYSNPIPQLSALRRIPMCYRRILPLRIMKQYQCIVVGAERGRLTVAIADERNMAVLELLSKYTGQAIFPVLIEPNRMRLLIRRIERGEQCNRYFYTMSTRLEEGDCYRYTLRRYHISPIVMLLSSHIQRFPDNTQRM